MATWYYAKAGSDARQGPVEDAQLRQLIAAGEVGADDLVWREGLATWQAVKEVAELSATSNVAARVAPVVAVAPTVVAGLPEGLRGWMGFVGVMNIIMGIFSCLGCVSLISGILMIVSGTALMGARTALESITEVNASLAAFFQKLKTYIQLTGIIYIVGLITALVGLLFFSSVIIAGIAAAMQQSGNM